MAKPELGIKRQCQNCGAKFFDLARDPIVCPKCQSVFQAPALSRAAPRAAAADDSDAADDAPPVEVISLEDADASDEKAVAATTEDIEIEDDDPATDSTFLEEEEEDADDVADLIDGDIESDEEA